MNRYSIKDLEQVSGIKAHTLRAWEQRYQIIEPKRTKTNIRFYDGKALRKLLNVCLLQEHGIKISKIAEMSHEEIVKHVNFYTADDGRFSGKVQMLTLYMMEYNPYAFEDTVNECIKNYGLEDTIMFVIYPFMQKIGFLWLTEAIIPAQEHLVSNLIRTKLLLATEALERPASGLSTKFILYLPEGEFHETTLLFANYIIKKQEQKAIYLGQNLPFPDLLKVHELHKTPYIFTAITAKNTENEKYIQRIADAFPTTIILVAGVQASTFQSKWDNVRLLMTPDDLLLYV